MGGSDKWIHPIESLTQTKDIRVLRGNRSFIEIQIIFYTYLLDKNYEE
jgi:hypothetical protein